MKRFTFKVVGRLLTELIVLLAIYFLGCQLAAWLSWPIPGGVVGLGLLLLTFATGLVKPAALQLGGRCTDGRDAAVLYSCLDEPFGLRWPGKARRLADHVGDRLQHLVGDAGDCVYRGIRLPLEAAP
ncbi:putative membrane protein [Pseudomonas sp. W2I6]|nr:putative membrane protein [Pseudomonas sp. W2I6]